MRMKTSDLGKKRNLPVNRHAASNGPYTAQALPQSTETVSTTARWPTYPQCILWFMPSTAQTAIGRRAFSLRDCLLACSLQYGDGDTLHPVLNHDGTHWPTHDSALPASAISFHGTSSREGQAAYAWTWADKEGIRQLRAQSIDSISANLMSSSERWSGSLFNFGIYIYIHIYIYSLSSVLTYSSTSRVV